MSDRYSLRIPTRTEVSELIFSENCDAIDGRVSPLFSCEESSEQYRDVRCRVATIGRFHTARVVPGAPNSARHCDVLCRRTALARPRFSRCLRDVNG